MNVEVPARQDSIHIRLQLPAGAVEVNGAVASASATKDILVVKPADGLSPGRHTLHIAYTGNPDESLAVRVRKI
ncbi:hypothetical protein ACGFYF_42530 [Streptomyces lavendulae]|uniref:hypothetical protein n=1 Tax=Streptomyces lavendulae TaxID=1914 RepID=UPI0037123A91